VWCPAVVGIDAWFIIAVGMFGVRLATPQERRKRANHALALPTRSASAIKFGHEGNCRSSSGDRLPSIFFSSRFYNKRCSVFARQGIKDRTPTGLLNLCVLQKLLHPTGFTQRVLYILLARTPPLGFLPLSSARWLAILKHVIFEFALLRRSSLHLQPAHSRVCCRGETIKCGPGGHMSQI
jgi:hypothetical protein